MFYRVENAQGFTRYILLIQDNLDMSTIFTIRFIS